MGSENNKGAYQPSLSSRPWKMAATSYKWAGLSRERMGNLVRIPVISKRASGTPPCRTQRDANEFRSALKVTRVPADPGTR